MQEGQGSRTADRVAERRAAHQVRDRPLVLADPIALRIIRLDAALQASGFDAAKPAFFSWLGVVPYLERPAIDATFRFVASLPPKSAVAFDYAVPPESLGWTARLIFWRIAKRVAALGEPWKT